MIGNIIVVSLPFLVVMHRYGCNRAYRGHVMTSNEAMIDALGAGIGASLVMMAIVLVGMYES